MLADPLRYDLTATASGAIPEAVDATLARPSGTISVFSPMVLRLSRGDNVSVMAAWIVAAS
jgi:hypothetical protein